MRKSTKSKKISPCHSKRFRLLSVLFLMHEAGILMENKVEIGKKDDSYTLLFDIISQDDSISLESKLVVFELMHLKEKIKDTNKASSQKVELDNKSDATTLLFHIIRQDDSIPLKNKLIIFKLLELKDKIKKKPMASEFESWIKNSELTLITDHPSSYPESEKESAISKKLKSPFRRRNNSLVETSTPNEQLSSSTDSEKDASIPKKIKTNVPRLPISASFHDKNNSPGRNSSSSAESPSSNKSSPIGSFFNRSPGRERFCESAPSLASTPRIMQEDKKPSIYSRRKSSSGTNILRKAHSASQNAPIDCPFKFPLDSITAKNYWKEGVAKFADAEKSILQLACVDMRYELLVIPIDPQNVKKLQVFLLDKQSILGEGGTASIVCAWNLETKELVAAKVYKSWHKDIKNEIRILRSKDKFHAFFNIDKPIILMRFSPGKNAMDLLYEADGVDEHGEPHYIKKNTFSPFITLKIIYKFLDKLSDLHKTKFLNNDIFPHYDKLDGLLHRDLKPTNLLLDIENNSEEVKLDIIDYADMIPNRRDGKNKDTCCGSNGYTPPEVIGYNDQRMPYTFESDYYQAGVTIAEFISSCMYQVGIQEFLKKHELNFNDYWTVGHMQALMPDVFDTKRYDIKLKPNEHTIEINVNEIIYQDIIFPALCKLAISMTKENPTLRLQGSSLENESNTLKKLEQTCLDLSKIYQSQIENALGAQKIVLDLSHILHTEQQDLTIQQLPIHSSLAELIHMLSGNTLEPVWKSKRLSFST